MPRFDPKKIIDFSIDYYGLLDMDKDAQLSSQDFLRQLETNFRSKAKACHPDRGGDPEYFKNLLRAKQILEDKLLKQIYDSGGFPDEVQSTTVFDIDWDQLGTYRKGTTPDILGYSYFIMLADEKEELGLTPSFIPKTNYDNYEWTFSLNAKPEAKLSISIIYSETDVLRLASGLKNTDTQLSFKIYVCVPTKQLTLKRDTATKIKYNDQVVLSLGKVSTAEFNDFILLETTSLEEADSFFENLDNIKTEINNYLQGKKSLYRPSEQQMWLDEKEITKIDTQLYNDILTLKGVFTVHDPSAADFLKNLPKQG